MSDINVTEADKELAFSILNGLLGSPRTLTFYELGKLIAAHRIAAIEECAKVINELNFAVDIEDHLAMTKQEMSALTCREGAVAIRKLKDKS